MKFTRNLYKSILCLAVGGVLRPTSTCHASVSPPPASQNSHNSSRSLEKNEQQELFLRNLEENYSHQPVFLQAVSEMATSLKPLFDSDPSGFYRKAFLIMAEPERVLSFRVPWVDDQGVLCINRGWRVEFSSVLGPYKGGLRFHPTVNEGILKFLGFEQIFKNALTGLPLGGGKGGSDFDPKGKSTAEIKRFCESFMTELHRYLHPSTDVPAGDIGVGGREIGFLMGQYKRLTNRHGEGVLTGKSVSIGGSYFRPEATGYGLVYIAKLAIERHGNKGQVDYGKSKTPISSLSGQNCAISGSGNVAQYAAQKLLELEAKVVTLSDSNGCLYFPCGMTKTDWDVIVKAKQVDRVRLMQIQDKVSGTYFDKRTPWNLMAMRSNENGSQFDYAFPCATQNEIDHLACETLVKNGLKGLFEGANLPTTISAQHILRQNPSILYIPGKASNAGGVGVSGFEMTQNAQKMSWSAEAVDEKLKNLMEVIYTQLVEFSGESELQEGDDDWSRDLTSSLERGANVAGFLKVVNAMKDLGWL